MRLRELSFKPALIPSVITFLTLPFLLALGVWQLHRAHQKEVLLADFKAHTALPYVPLSALDPTDPSSLYRRVIAEGRYDREHQILLDNQIRDGQPGYHVYTPLRLRGRPGGILVNRGWVPLGASREQLPDIEVPGADVTLKGWLAQPANPGLRLGEAARVSWPRVVQYLDYKDLVADLGYPLEPVVILLAPEEKNGYWREWRPQFGAFGPERHWGYAVQWFALALALLAIFIAVNIERRSEEA
jgi:surfeit locus 1 family protein